MNTAFERMAGDKKVWFSDASQWNVELSFDQVHFSERGHKIFAERMAELLENILCLEKQAQKKRPI
jgi:lysophospholipase L1-like esterase